MTKEDAMSALEEMAFREAVKRIGNHDLQELLLNQIKTMRVKNRTPKTTGYYADFYADEFHEIKSIENQGNVIFHSEAVHPDGVNAVFFDFYFKNGFLSFMEASSTSEWPHNEESIITFL